MLLQILLNLTVIMYYTQVLNPPDGWWQFSQLLGPLVWLGTTIMDSTLVSYLFALNAVALVIWECGAGRRITWMQGSLFPRLIAFSTLGTVLIPTLIIIVAAGFEEKTGLSVISPVLLLAATGARLYQRYDLFILICSLLILAILVIAQVAGAAWWLRQIAQRWETKS